ncbi:hypothetical protein ElyMa_000812400 [Elysia marginata]|uniref:Uncharacterized protein n=1 Tax=Elysia marginata TaxID=1093978 RepID=A0AAV4GXU1_9GAST|nr:hypothetical protein ElyMa_000812400 [Elysia marginata]
MAKVSLTTKALMVATIALVLLLGESKSQLGSRNQPTLLQSSESDITSNDGDRAFVNSHWNGQTRDLGDRSNHDNDGTRNNRRNRWVAGQSNCTCSRELSSLKRDLREEVLYL